MNRILSACPVRVRHMLRGEDGAASIEAVLWMPVFFGFLGFVVDVSMIFSERAQILRMMQDGNRALAASRIDTVDDAQDFIAANVHTISPGATVETAVQSGVVTTVVTVPTSELAVVGLMPQLLEKEMRLTARHLLEL